MVKIVVIPNVKPPTHKLADVELHFTLPPLVGIKLVGIAIWTTREGAYNVTFPARSYQGEGGIRYFNFLRAIHPPHESGWRPLDDLKHAVITEYEASRTRAA